MIYAETILLRDSMMIFLDFLVDAAIAASSSKEACMAICLAVFRALVCDVMAFRVISSSSLSSSKILVLELNDH